MTVLLTPTVPPPKPTTSQRLSAAAWAAWHSLYITFLAILSGLTTQAVMDGQTSSWEQYLLYLKSKWLPWTVANIVAPALRSTLAAAKPPEKATS